MAVAALAFRKVCTRFGGAAANIPGDPVNVVSSGPSENSTSPCRT